MSIGVHAGWNRTQGWLFGAAVSGSQDFAGGLFVTKSMADVPSWLSGGQFRPEAPLTTLLICTALGFGVLRLTWSRGNMHAEADREAAVPGGIKRGRERMLLCFWAWLQRRR
jgi:hypothetical protein